MKEENRTFEKSSQNKAVKSEKEEIESSKRSLQASWDKPTEKTSQRLPSSENFDSEEIKKKVLEKFVNEYHDLPQDMTDIYPILDLAIQEQRKKDEEEFEKILNEQIKQMENNAKFMREETRERKQFSYTKGILEMVKFNLKKKA